MKNDDIIESILGNSDDLLKIAADCIGRMAEDEERLLEEYERMRKERTMWYQMYMDMKEQRDNMLAKLQKKG
jgi:hypothetical protein